VRPYKRIKLELLAQRYPQWISYGSPAWLDERLLALGEYSELPVLNSHYVLAGLLESGSPSLADVRARKVIVIHGYDYSATFYEWVESNKIQLVYAPSHKHALAMLRQYRGDFYMAEALRVGWQARRMGVSANELFIIDFSEVIPPSVVYFLLDKRISPAMRAHINQRLFEIKQSGELANIVAQYQ
jgi:polar amino acid transport system substrate-binding protein